MSFTNQTTHYGLPQWIGSDKPTYLVDQNNAYQTIDSELYNANTAAGEAVTTAQGAVTTAEGAASTAATALSTAQGAETTANTADGKADNAITLAQSAQTAAGAAQTAAEAAQTAAAGNSITNLAPAYDPTQAYNVGALVTQDGKLYQCITQVSVPEAFDINKWDDKTTSEVYYIKSSNTIYGLVGQEHYTISANTHATMSDALAWIASHAQDIFQLEADEIASPTLIWVTGYSTFTPKHFNYINAESTTMLMGFFATDVTANHALISKLETRTTPVFMSAVIANGSFTIGDKLAETQPELVIYFDRYKKI